MDYHPVADAKTMSGLRISLTKGVPAPWSESAKAMLKVKGIPYVAVEQLAGTENEELVAWTGHRNAPTAMYEAEPPRVTWLDILNLVERLQPDPPLVPERINDRITMHGLMNEIAGENGMLWSTRQIMFRAMADALGEDAVADNPMFRDYRYSREAADTAIRRAIAILQRIEEQLTDQSAIGSPYLVGDRLSAVDLYWACFSQTLDPLPQDVNPMPDYLRSTWASAMTVMSDAGYTPKQCLFDHRNRMFEDYIGLPLAF
ncbi:MAG: glutathione binding-like protein [Cyanobacteria bacterium P01_G01_bin.4]